MTLLYEEELLALRQERLQRENNEMRDEHDGMLPSSTTDDDGLHSPTKAPKRLEKNSLQIVYLPLIQDVVW